MNQRNRWTVAAWALTSGCAAAPQPARAPAEPAATITFRTKTLRTFEHATVTDRCILGPNIDVTRSGDNYRGRAHGEVVDLQWEATRSRARLGMAPPRRFGIASMRMGSCWKACFPAHADCSLYARVA